MPPPALKSLASKAGKSLKDAERYYDDAKKQRMKSTGKSEKGLTDQDYQYIMGVVKKRLKLPTKKAESLAESLIEYVIGKYDEDDNVRVFSDIEGNIAFCSLDDIHIDPESDPRLALIDRVANQHTWPHNHEFPECIEGYEGSISKLADDVLTKVLPGFYVETVGPVKPRMRTLDQKQGARKAGRTRSRKQYTERHGYLLHNYYTHDE